MDLEATLAFIKVVETGSFTRAAELLKMPKSSVSRAVSRLESDSRTRLLFRTTRSLKLTDVGQAFFERCAGPMQALEEARRSLEAADEGVSGRVRLTAPEDLGRYVISSEVRALARKYPALSFDFRYTDEILDLVREGYDLAFRIGRLPASRFKAIKLGEIPFILVAAPKYLERAARISGPEDLRLHDCLVFSPESRVHRWILYGTLYAKSKKSSVIVRARFTGNHTRSLSALAAEGGGIALLPSIACREELSSGKLLRVLPEWCGERMPVYLLSPHGIGASRRVRAVGEHLTEAVRRALVAI